MALDVDQLALVRSWVGDQPDDAALNAIFDRTGSLFDSIREVLRTRYANLLRNPSSFAVTGYSQSTGANMAAMRELLAKLEATGEDGLEEVGGVSVVRRVRYDTIRGR